LTRGRRPEVAIAEAMKHASASGFEVISVHAAWIPCDFLAIRQVCITLVRVRRLRYRHFAVPDIERSCRQEIAELREIPISGDVARELWVRGPDRSWYRYRVLPDRVDAVSRRYQPAGQQTLATG
jgi:hypothetical protein